MQGAWHNTSLWASEAAIALFLRIAAFWRSPRMASQNAEADCSAAGKSSEKSFTVLRLARGK